MTPWLLAGHGWCAKLGAGVPRAPQGAGPPPSRTPAQAAQASGRPNPPAGSDPHYEAARPPALLARGLAVTVRPATRQPHAAALPCVQPWQGVLARQMAELHAWNSKGSGSSWSPLVDRSLRGLLVRASGELFACDPLSRRPQARASDSPKTKPSDPPVGPDPKLSQLTGEHLVPVRELVDLLGLGHGRWTQRRSGASVPGSKAKLR